MCCFTDTVHTVISLMRILKIYQIKQSKFLNNDERIYEKLCSIIIIIIIIINIVIIN